jgi:hypothetical protein
MMSVEEVGVRTCFCLHRLEFKIARWQIFKPKIPNSVNFGGSCNERCWSILWTFGLFYSHMEYIIPFWFILWSFGIFSPVLVGCYKKNLATLVSIRQTETDFDRKRSRFDKANLSVIYGRNLMSYKYFLKISTCECNVNNIQILLSKGHA